MKNFEIENNKKYDNFKNCKAKKTKPKQNRIISTPISSIIEILIFSIIIILFFNLNQKEYNSFDNTLENKSKYSSNIIPYENIQYSFKAVYNTNTKSTNESAKLIDSLYINNIKEISINNKNIKPCSNYSFPSIGNYTIIMSINLTNLSSLYRIFYLVRNMTSIYFSQNFNTENITKMSYMLLYCSQLTSIDITNFNTKNVEDMSYMFANCESLFSINFINFNTVKVIKKI